MTKLAMPLVFGLLLIFSLAQISPAQTCGTPGKDGSGSISNVVNTYYPSPSSTTASGTSIPVGAVDNIESGLTPISAGDLILIFQTQNASIDTSNDSNYGSGSGTGNGFSSNSAGFYEYAVATNNVSTSGGTITVSANLTRTYRSSTTIGTSRGKQTYQVIRVPQYLDVTISGTVQAATWDGKSGGLVAIDVAGNLNMGGGTISAAGKGFRGGLGRSLGSGSGNSSDYVTLSSAGNNASKGEGVVGTPRYVWDGLLGIDTTIEGYPSGTYARGAPGNAGGGGTDGDPSGNTQNSGGGGGGNGGQGGQGGNSWSSNLAIGGVGGATFPASVTRISLGGGGGAGTTNNGAETTSSGASGGGAVLIRTGSVSGSGAINVDGNNAQDSNPNCCGDGAGGGGAGGSIIVTASNTSGLSGIVGYARGGRGGSTLVAESPHGPGGGGGGGVILSNSALSSSSSVSGGNNGTTTSSSDPYGATGGNTGSINNSISLTSIPGSSPGVSCSSSLSITKSSNGPWAIGQTTAQYTLTITNSGAVATTGTITVRDTLPNGITPNWTGTRSVTNGGLTWSCTFSGQDVTCTTSNGLSRTSGSNTSQITLPVNIAVSTAIGTNSITNYASVGGANDPYNTGTTPPPGASCTNTAHCTSNQTTIQSPDLTIAKSHTGNFTRGSTGTYTLTVSNSPGTVATSGTITVTDTLPTGLSVNGGAVGTVIPGGTNAANWTCNSNAATPQLITCTSTTAIAISGNSVFTLPVNVSNSAASSITNNVAVSGGNEATANNGNNSATDPTTTVSAVDLTLAKSHTGNFTVGSSGTYSFSVTNIGAATSSGTITVTDTLPSGLTINGGAAGGITEGGTNAANWTCNSNATNPQTITCTSTTAIAANGTSVFNFAVNVGLGTAVGTNSITNSASVSGGGETNTGNNSATDPTTVLSPNLTIAKSHSGNFPRGGTGAYTLTIGNSGTVATSGTITVTDTLPTRLSVTAGAVTISGANSANWTCNAAGQVITCTSTTAIAISGSSVFSFNVNVASNAAASVTNSVAVSGGNEATANNGNNSATDPTTTYAPADLTLAKSHTGNFTVGSSGTYSLTVTNSGTGSTTGAITVTDTLPSGLTVNGGAAGGITEGGTNAANWTCNSDASNPQTITCTSSTAISNTAGSNTSVFNFAVNVGLGTAVGTNSITNSASVSGGGEINTSNNSATDPTTVLSPNLTIAKSHTGNFTRGSTGTYTLTVSNSPGTVATSGTVTVIDTLPTGLSVTAGSITPGGTNAANWTCNAAGQVITCTSTTAIAISGTSVFTLTVNVSNSAASSVTNNVAVSGGNEATANNGNNTATDPTTINANPPNVSLTKSCPSPSNCTSVAQLPGTDITYRIVFTNTGGQGAANLTIVDAVPSNMDYKLSSAATSLGTTGLTFAIEFSSDYDPLNPTLATWTYTPVSGGGNSTVGFASVGYDRLVKAVRWRVTSGTLSQTSPDNTGNVSFIAKIR